MKSIEEVAGYLDITPEQTGKAVFYKDADGNLVFVCIRGDIEVNEAKLRKITQSPTLEFADDDAIRQAGAEPGYASLLDLNLQNVRAVVDRSFAETSNLVVGANETDYHIKNFNFERDVPDKSTVVVADIATVRDGDPCPVTGKPLTMLRGIEVGNIFQLGPKYSEAMGATYLDKDGKAKTMIMGCYGIGVGRTMAAVIEQSHDKYGPIWPMSIAPFQVHICALNPDRDNVGEVAGKLYRELTEQGVEVILDDRGEKAGFMFNDADLIGAPLRLIVSPKTLAENQVEFKRRNSRDKSFIPLDQVVDAMIGAIADSR
jgi:prolyl-tRNA synthetase